MPGQHCPVCGGPNDCAVASGTFGSAPCWCASVHIARELLDRLPDAQRGRTCVCRGCIGRAGAQPAQ